MTNQECINLIRQSIPQEDIKLHYALDQLEQSLIVDYSETDYEKVVLLFKQNNNTPLPTSKIVKLCNITRSSLSQILYRTHKNKFVSQSKEGCTRRKLWRLI